jgi:hypothetical protein
MRSRTAFHVDVDVDLCSRVVIHENANQKTCN